MQNIAKLQHSALFKTVLYVQCTMYVHCMYIHILLVEGEK